MWSHNLADIDGQPPQLPFYNAFTAPLPPQRFEAPPTTPLVQRNAALCVDDSTVPLPSRRQRKRADANRSVRKRITRACDQCNQARTKCDGQLPCAPCIKLDIECQYNREQKKRGKVSRRELDDRATFKDNNDGSISRQTSASAASSDKLNGSADLPGQKKDKKPDAGNVRSVRQAIVTSLPPPPAARSAPVERTFSASMLNGGGKPTPLYAAHSRHIQQTNGMCQQEYMLDYEEGGKNSSDCMESQHILSPYLLFAEQFSTLGHSSCEQPFSKAPMAQDQPGGAPLQGVGQHISEPMFTDGSPANWQNIV